MTCIEIMAIMEDADGETFKYIGEIGTPEFHQVKTTLQKYLNTTLWLYTNNEENLFVIENEDEGCDNSFDYVKIIENIYESVYIGKRNFHLEFEIIKVISLSA